MEQYESKYITYWSGMPGDFDDKVAFLNHHGAEGWWPVSETQLGASKFSYLVTRKVPAED